MVSTGLQNNQLFPGLLISLLISTGAIIFSTVSNVINGAENGVSNPVEFVVFIPLFVALWGASLFKPGNKGMVQNYTNYVDYRHSYVLAYIVVCIKLKSPTA